MRALAESFWHLPQTSERLIKRALQLVDDIHPATLREIRWEMLIWRDDLAAEANAKIMLDDLTGVLGQLRDLQHDLEG
jgi:hypothetical protein